MAHIAETEEKTEMEETREAKSHVEERWKQTQIEAKRDDDVIAEEKGFVEE